MRGGAGIGSTRRFRGKSEGKYENYEYLVTAVEVTSLILFKIQKSIQNLASSVMRFYRTSCIDLFTCDFDWAIMLKTYLQIFSKPLSKTVTGR